MFNWLTWITAPTIVRGFTVVRFYKNTSIVVLGRLMEKSIRLTISDNEARLYTNTVVPDDMDTLRKDLGYFELESLASLVDARRLDFGFHFEFQLALTHFFRQ